MNPYDTTPTFNLKVVIQETGIKPDTLRAWERRYGLPVPGRTPGGHRLYSQHDIETLKWLLARQSEGMSISKAVKLWRSLEQEGDDPLAVMGYTAASETAVPAIPTGAPITDLRHGWIEACAAFDESAAERVLTQAFALYPAQLVVIEILQKGLAQIGRDWYQNKVSVQQEHFASALAIRRLNALAAATPSPSRPGKIMIGCPPDERHTFPPLLLTLLLRYQGWEALYLGADVPLNQMEETITAVSPRLVILTAQQIHTAATLRQMAHLLAEQEVPVAFGGRIFNLLPSLCEKIPGHFLGDTMETAVQTAVNIAAYKLPISKPLTDSRFDPSLITGFRNHQNGIESRVWEKLKLNGTPYQYIANANQFLAQDIIAALTFGDITLLNENIAWIETLLTNYQRPVQSLKEYLAAYYQAVQGEMGKSGWLISEWLKTTSDQIGTVSGSNATKP